MSDGEKKTLTAQEVFDRAVGGVIRQGRKAAVPRDIGCGVTMRCTYLTPDGARCAAGQLLEPDELDLLRERGQLSRNWDGLRDRGLVPDRLRPHHSLTMRIQLCHDEWDPDADADPFMEYFVRRAREVAESMGLSTEAMDEAYAAHRASVKGAP